MTPLMNQWTYQAMIHEMIGTQGIVNNSLKFEPTAPQIESKAPLAYNLLQSKFYETHQFDFWPEVQEALVARGQEWKKDKQNLRESMSQPSNAPSEDQRVIGISNVDKGPDLDLLSNDAKKEMEMCTTIVAELDNRVNCQRMLEVGTLEQALVNTDERGASAFKSHFEQLEALLVGCDGGGDGGLSNEVRQLDQHDPGQKLQRERLLLLFALRHKDRLWTPQQTRGVGRAVAAMNRDKLVTNDPGPGSDFYRLMADNEIKLVEKLVRRMNRVEVDGATNQLLQAMGKARRDFAQQLAKEGKEEFELLQHRPRLAWTLKLLTDGKLPHDPSGYPILDPSTAGANGSSQRDREAGAGAGQQAAVAEAAARVAAAGVAGGLQVPEQPMIPCQT